MHTAKHNRGGKIRGGAIRPGRFFMLMEVVVALGTLLLILTGIFAGLRLSERMQDRFLLEDRALEVLDNSVERLAAEARPDTGRAIVVLREEFARSGLAANQKATLACEMTGPGLEVTIRTRGGHRLAGVILPAAPGTGAKTPTRKKP